MALDFVGLSPEELLAAESAVLTMRSLMDAAKAAPVGHGFERVESALHATGFDHLRTMLQAAMASHDGAQKKGPAVLTVRAEKKPGSNAGPTRRF